MSLIIFNQNGNLEACASSVAITPGLRGFRVVEGFRVDIAQFILPNFSVAFVIDNLVTSIWGYSPHDRILGPHSDDDSAPELVRYPGRVILLITNIQNDIKVWLLDVNGYVLAGSNVFPLGNYCLGEQCNPYSMNPVEMLLEYEANDDLVWRGHSLEGAWINDSPPHPRHFQITTWPTITQIWTPPKELFAEPRLW